MATRSLQARLNLSAGHMGKVRNLPWHDEARKMHADGLSSYAIAKHFGKAVNTVRYAVDPINRAKTRNRVRRLRGLIIPDGGARA